MKTVLPRGARLSSTVRLSHNNYVSNRQSWPVHIDLREKRLAAIVGMLFVIAIAQLFPWWLALFGVMAMAPFGVIDLSRDAK